MMIIHILLQNIPNFFQISRAGKADPSISMVLHQRSPKRFDGEKIYK